MSVKATHLLDCATSGRWQMQQVQLAANRTPCHLSKPLLKPMPTQPSARGGVQALLVKAMHALGTRRKMRSGACAVASQRRSRCASAVRALTHTTLPSLLCVGRPVLWTRPKSSTVLKTPPSCKLNTAHRVLAQVSRRPLFEMRNDLRRRAPHYVSDWRDGCHPKVPQVEDSQSTHHARARAHTHTHAHARTCTHTHAHARHTPSGMCM